MYNVLTFISILTNYVNYKVHNKLFEEYAEHETLMKYYDNQIAFSHILNDLHSQQCPGNSSSKFKDTDWWGNIEKTVLHMAEKYVALVKQKYQYSLILYQSIIGLWTYCLPQVY